MQNLSLTFGEYGHDLIMRL